MDFETAFLIRSRSPCAEASETAGSSMTANEFVIEVGNKISGRAIPVRTPNMLKAAEVLSPASLSFKGIKIASILVKRFKTTRFPVKGTDKRPIFGRAFLKSQSRN